MSSTSTNFSPLPQRCERSFQAQNDVQKWLDIVRGSYAPPRSTTSSSARSAAVPVLRRSPVALPSALALVPSERRWVSCNGKLLTEKHNTFWHDYKVLIVAGASAGVGLAALPPVRSAIGSGFETKTITLTCGKLTTGITVPQWSSI